MYLNSLFENQMFFYVLKIKTFNFFYFCKLYIWQIAINKEIRIITVFSVWWHYYNICTNFLYFLLNRIILFNYWTPQTFEAKIHHLETRLSRKPKDGLEDLEYYVQCEVHLSDVSTLVSSLKRSAEDVKTTKEVKCESIKAQRCSVLSFAYLNVSSA